MIHNIHIIGISKGEEKEQGIEKPVKKIMTGNFSNLLRAKVIQVQKAQRVPIKMNPKRPTPTS